MKAIDGLAVSIILLSIGVSAVLVTSTTLEFSRYNTGWNGTSAFFDRAEVKHAVEIHDLSSLGGLNDSLLLMIAPVSAYSNEEIKAYSEFLASGNTLFISDETGASNTLLSGVGSEIRILRGNISSINTEYNDPGSVIAYLRIDDLLLDGVSSIVFNGPAAVSGGESLLSTSTFSWNDLDGNRHPDAGEPLSRITILAREQVETGTVYVCSDSSIFINAMSHTNEGRDNGQFLKNIVFRNSNLLIEQSRSATASEGDFLAFIHVARNTMIIKILVVLVSVIIFALVFYRRYFR